MSQSDALAIVGAGLAGLSLVDAILKEGTEASRITVIDSGDPRRGSSTPATMLHPFPGRTIRLSRGQGDSFVRSWEILQGWRRRLGDEKWWCSAAMVRPIDDDDRGRQLLESWEDVSPDFPAPITGERLSAAAVTRRFAGIESEVDALIYEPAAAVLIPKLIELLRADLEGRGVTFIDRKVKKIRHDQPGWSLISGRIVLWEGARVVMANGPWLHHFFHGLDLRCRAGEVAVLDPGDAELGATVNGKKHLFVRPDGTWGLGSTYFRPPQWDERDDEHIVEKLKAGVADFVPAVWDARVVQIWRGIRGVFGSDHMPLVGPVPGSPGLFSFAAFGSKGLLWAPSAAADMARYLGGDGEAISTHMDARRMSREKWGIWEGMMG